MKTFTKAAMAVTLAALVSPRAQAAFAVDDLYLGFNSGSAASDYIIDLGNANTAVGVGGSSTKDLSSLISTPTFNSVFTSGANGVDVGVVGGNNTFNQYNVYATQLRAGGAGDAPSAGSDLAGANHSSGTLAAAAGTLTGNPWPTAGNFVVDSTKSFTSKVGPALTGTDFYGKSGVNPFGTIGSSSVIYEDLWYGTVANGYQYEGYFELDLSGATPSLTFTPATVPEPGTYALIGIAGLLFVSARRWFRNHQV